MKAQRIFNCIFKNMLGETLVVKMDADNTIEELINSYFKKKEKENLIIENIENTYFIFNNIKIDYKNNKHKLIEFFQNNPIPSIIVCRLDYKEKYKDIKEIEKIKDGSHTYVYKAKYGDKLVAVKKIKKEQLIEDIRESLYVAEITKEHYINEIIKFNRELTAMIKCYCENSVEIYDYFDTEKGFIIVMELCDNNLYRQLSRTTNGFTAEEIKEILLQLNNVFRKFN